MPTEQSFIKFRESIGHELDMQKNRVRNLIGPTHWQTDGEHKEAVLRKVLRSFAPEMFRIGRGFICYPRSAESSTQLDILITSRLRPTLYQDDDLMFVTSSTVEAVVEVKTRLAKGVKFTRTLNTLADELERIRATSEQNRPCWGGLFVYEEGNSLSHEYVLQSLQKVSEGRIDRIINCVCLGTDLFFRFWPRGHPDSSPEKEAMWHSYQLKRLAQPYFIGNLVFHITPDFSIDDAWAWFPIPGTKEVRRRFYAKLLEKKARRF